MAKKCRPGWRQQRADMWTGLKARRAWIVAFEGGLGQKPVWLKDLRIEPGLHDGPNRIATAICKNGKEIPIKALCSAEACKHFKHNHPKPPMAMIPVEEGDSAEQIRWRTYNEIAKLR